MKKIGKYELVEKIGSGSMGMVWRAFDPAIRRSVALKTMTEAGLERSDLRARFLREAQAAGQLRHPNVVTIYDLGEEGDSPYIVMELLDGEDLAHLIARKEQLSLDRRLELMVQVLRGLDYAHQQGVVHRDVKPANIHVTGDGSAKIMDFGIAHLTSSEMTRTGTILGTVNYMSPEQITGAKLDGRSDLFSVGIILHELLTFRNPFGGSSVTETMYNIVHRPPAVPDELPTGTPPELRRILFRALEKDPAQRYQTALEMAADLEALLAARRGSSTAEALARVQSATGGTEIATGADFARTAAVSGVISPAVARGSGAPAGPPPASPSAAGAGSGSLEATALASSAAGAAASASIPAAGPGAAPVAAAGPRPAKKSHLGLILGVAAVALFLVLAVGGFAAWKLGGKALGVLRRTQPAGEDLTAETAAPGATGTVAGGEEGGATDKGLPAEAGEGGAEGAGAPSGASPGMAEGEGAGPFIEGPGEDRGRGRGRGRSGEDRGDSSALPADEGRRTSGSSKDRPEESRERQQPDDRSGPGDAQGMTERDVERRGDEELPAGGVRPGTPPEEETASIPPKALSKRLFSEGQEDYNRRRYAEAVRKLTRALELDPQNAQVFPFLVAALYDGGDQLEARSRLYEGLSRFPFLEMNPRMMAYKQKLGG